MRMRALKACCAALLLGLSAQAGFEGITCLDWSPAGDKLLLASQGALYLGCLLYTSPSPRD